MRNGFTTGSCAAAAGKAAAYMLLGGNRIDRISITTPAGITYTPELEEITVGERSVSCAVRKDGGDDPDVTNGALICAKVRILPENALPGGFGEVRTLPEDAPTGGSGEVLILPENAPVGGFGKDDPPGNRVCITAGPGVGTVTRPGLDQSVGNAAINSVPRQMIRREIGEVMELFDFHGFLEVEISVPGGEELAGKTFNPRLGIEGGISILGTTGIVEPMSTAALLQTIRLELNQLRETGASDAVVSPGNYGMAFMKERFGYDLDKAVKCSNYIGETIDMAAELGFRRLLLCGHLGKLIKVSGGIMNTHSREADARMELMAAAAARCGASGPLLNRILGCLSAEEAYACCLEEGIGKECASCILDRISYYLDRRAAGRLQVECIVCSNRFGLIGMTQRAEEILGAAGRETI